MDRASGPHSPRLSTASGLRGYLLAVTRFQRNAKLFLAVTALRGMVIASLATVLNLYLYSLGYDQRFIGLASGANALATLATSFPAGYLTDHIGRRPVLLIGGLGYPLAITGLTFSTTAPAIILFNVLFGIFAVAYWTAGIPLLYASTSESERVQAFSVNSFLLWGLGPIGAFFSGQIVEIAAHALGISASSPNALRYGMLTMAAFAFLGALPYFPMRETRHPAEHSETPPLPSVLALFARLLTPDLVMAFGVGAVLTFAQLYFHLRFGLDPGPIGLIVGLGGTVAGAATLTTPFFARRWGNLRTVVTCNSLASLLILAMAVAMLLWLGIAAYWLVVALRGMSDPAYTAFIQERVPEAYRGRASGLYSVTYSIGASLGPVVSGQIQNAGGFTPAFLLGGACYFAGTAMLYSFFRRTPLPIRRSQPSASQQL